jgi:hypothetical protein
MFKIIAKTTHISIETDYNRAYMKNSVAMWF